jgi:hypothetical protein
VGLPKQDHTGAAALFEQLGDALSTTSSRCLEPALERAVEFYPHAGESSEQARTIRKLGFLYLRPLSGRAHDPTLLLLGAYTIVTP